MKGEEDRMLIYCCLCKSLKYRSFMHGACLYLCISFFRLSKQVGNKLCIGGFLRVQVGEGLEATAKGCLAEEVAKVISSA